MFRLKNSFNYKGIILEPGTALPTDIPEGVIKNMIEEGTVEEFNPDEIPEINPDAGTEDKDVSGSGNE